MLHWLSAILAFLAVGIVSTWLAQGPLRRRDETATGIAALSALSWREFIGIVLEALAKRGYRRPADRGTPVGDADLTLLRDNGEQWLLSAKHGSAFVLGRPLVDELVAGMARTGAAGGLVVTQGRIGDDARKAAHGQPIQLLDGATLWPWLRPLLPASVVTPIIESATSHARERTLGGWLLALLMGVAVFFFFSVMAPAAPGGIGPDVASAAVASSAADRPRPEPAAVDEASGGEVPRAGRDPAADPGPDPDPDPATLEAQRRELASHVATLPIVARTVWTSSSTLQIFLVDTQEDPVAAICPLMVRYPALAASRIQLTPPEGSERPVRFRQCRSY